MTLIFGFAPRLWVTLVGGRYPATTCDFGMEPQMTHDSSLKKTHIVVQMVRSQCSDVYRASVQQDISWYENDSFGVSHVRSGVGRNFQNSSLKKSV